MEGPSLLIYTGLNMSWCPDVHMSKCPTVICYKHMFWPRVKWSFVHSQMYTLLSLEKKKEERTDLEVLVLVQKSFLIFTHVSFLPSLSLFVFLFFFHPLLLSFLCLFLLLVPSFLFSSFPHLFPPSVPPSFLPFISFPFFLTPYIPSSPPLFLLS